MSTEEDLETVPADTRPESMQTPPQHNSSTEEDDVIATEIDRLPGNVLSRKIKTSNKSVKNIHKQRADAAEKERRERERKRMIQISMQRIKGRRKRKKSKETVGREDLKSS